jgi:DNA primase
MNTGIEFEPIIEILEDIFGDYKLHSDYKGQISFDCPVCSYDIKQLDRGDGKGNLEINYKRGVYKCWSCAETHDTHGSIFKLVKKYGSPRQNKKFSLLMPEEVDEVKRIYKKVYLPKEFISFKDVSQGLKLTPQFKQAWNYIKKRNVTDQMIEKFNIGFCYTGLYENRIIIPSYDTELTLNYFIARSYLSKTKLKYKNPEVQKEIIIWNEHLINWEERLYIVEGAFDSIFVPNSIPMLGKFMSDNLFKTIYTNAKKDIVIVLDPDAWNDATRLYHKMNCGKLMGRVFIVKLDGDQDIADLKGDLSNYEIKQID